MLGPVLADGLATHLGAGAPLAWHASDGAGSVAEEAAAATGAGGGGGGPKNVCGQLLLVTKGRLSFLGGGDRERGEAEQQGGRQQEAGELLRQERQQAIPW